MKRGGKKFLIVNAWWLGALIVGTSHAQSCKPSRTGEQLSDTSAVSRCLKAQPASTVLDRKITLAAPQRPLANDARMAVDDGDGKKSSQDNGRFELAGRAGLIPTGRVGWREIGSWREARRNRADR